MKDNESELEIYIDKYELSSLIGDVYDASLTNQWTNLLSRIIEVTHSNKASIFLKNRQQAEPLLFEFQTNIKDDKQILIDYNNHFNKDPFYNMTKTAVEGESLNVHDYIHISEIENADYFLAFLKPLKAYYCLASILIRNGNYDSVFVINRTEDGNEYTARDLNLIKLLTPHLSRSIHTFKTLQLHKNYTSISHSIIEQIEKIIFVCDAQGRVVLSNEVANNSLTETGLLSVNNGKLVIKHDLYNKMLQQYILNCADNDFFNIGDQKSIILDDDTTSMLIKVSPLNLRHEFNDIDVPCCLVSINIQNNLNWQLLSLEYHLTLKELSLLKSIYQQKKLNDLTDDFEVTYNTLRSHLQAIFKKVGVNSQTDLMIKLSMFRF